MISIKKYIRGGEPTGVQSLVPVVQMLMKGFVSKVVEFDPEQAQRFRSNVLEAADTLDESLPLAEFLVQASAVIKSLEEYNHQVSSYVQAQRTEMHTMLKMLTDTLATMVKGSDESISKLQRFEKQLKNASGIVDVAVLKMRLSDCLTDIREEARRQQRESELAVEHLTREIARAREQVTTTAEYSDRDPCTGLRMRESAEGLIRERCGAQPPTLIAVLTVERLQTYNSRFGHGVGDQVLRYFASEVQAGISERDQVFRWTGASLVVVMDLFTTIDQAHVAMKRMTSQISGFTAHTRSRTVLLPIACRWGLLTTTTESQSAIKKIDQLCSSHSGEVTMPSNGVSGGHTETEPRVALN